MSIPKIHSIQSISAKYNTGDEPVLVLCSDKRQYICKYMRSSATIAYKLACEYIGAKLAAIWKINTPPVALVNILPAHWETVNVTHNLSAPAIGFQKLENVIDITPTFTQIAANKKTLMQLLKIGMVMDGVKLPMIKDFMLHLMLRLVIWLYLWVEDH